MLSSSSSSSSQSSRSRSREARRLAAAKRRLRKQENVAKKLKDAAEREIKENLKRYCRIAELEETIRKQEASFKRTLWASEEKCAQLTEENMRLKTDLEMKKHISTFVVSGACWQYEMDGSWHALPPEGNEQMQKAYLAYLQDLPNSRHATISSGGVARVVDFEMMKQRHLATKKVRSIRILPNVPAQWVSTPAELLQQGDHLRSFYKEVADKEILDSIHRILQETGHAQDTSGHWGPCSCSCMRAAKVKSVHRIENYRLWHRYKTRIGAMRQDNTAKKVVIESAPLDLDGSKRIMEEAQAVFHCGEVLDPDVDEKILLHGTSWENANSIVREGFDHRTCQNAFYGAGVYFAGAACKSHQYTCENHKPLCCNCWSERTLIISRVALGDSYLATETRKKERRPPLRRESSGTYDSIMVKPGAIQGHPKTKQIHQEFVIFDREQAYPCYVVQYELWRCGISSQKTFAENAEVGAAGIWLRGNDATGHQFYYLNMIYESSYTVFMSEFSNCFQGCYFDIHDRHDPPCYQLILYRIDASENNLEDLPMALMLQELLQNPGRAEKTQQFCKRNFSHVPCHSYELSFHEVKLALEHKLVEVIKRDSEDELGRAGMGRSRCKLADCLYTSWQKAGSWLFDGQCFLLRDELFISVCLLLVQSSGTLSFHTSLSCSLVRALCHSCVFVPPPVTIHQSGEAPPTFAASSSTKTRRLRLTPGASRCKGCLI